MTLYEFSKFVCVYVWFMQVIIIHLKSLLINKIGVVRGEGRKMKCFRIVRFVGGSCRCRFGNGVVNYVK